jgi:hypothetical protein
LPQKIRSERAFRDLISQVLPSARKTLQTTGGLIPAAFLVTDDGLVTYVVEASEGTLDGAVASLNPIGVIFVSESWVSVYDDPKDVVAAYGDSPGMEKLREDIPPPSQDPRRKEAILLTWEWKGYPDHKYKSGQKIQQFRRDPTGIILEDVKSIEGADPRHSKFKGFLRG